MPGEDDVPLEVRRRRSGYRPSISTDSESGVVEPVALCASRGILVRIEAQDPASCRVHRELAGIGAVDHGALEQALFAQHSGQRVGILAARAVRHPDPSERVGAQQRNDARAKRPRKNPDRKRGRRIRSTWREPNRASASGSWSRRSCSPEIVATFSARIAVGDASFERGLRVLGKVVPAEAQDRFQQRLSSRSASAFSRAGSTTLRRYRFNHTRKQRNQLIHIDRLTDVLRSARGNAALAIAAHRLSGQCDDRQIGESRVRRECGGSSRNRRSRAS